MKKVCCLILDVIVLIICSLIIVSFFTSTGRYIDGFSYDYETAKYKIMLFFCMMFWALVIFFISQISEKLVCHEKTVICCILGVIVLLGILSGYYMQIMSDSDVAQVYKGSLNLFLQGNLGETEDYFYRYQNNLGMVFVLYLIRFITANVLKDTIAFTFCNILSLFFSVWFLWRLIRMIIGKKQAIMAVIVISLCVPIYLFIPVFYTDTFSMPFVMGGIYFFLHADKMNKRIEFLISGLLIGIGAVIKMSVIILFVAIVIYLILKNNIFYFFKKCFLVSLPLIVCLCLYQYCSTRILDDREKYDRESLPISSWILMGIDGDGRFSGEDVFWTLSFQDKDVAREKNIEEIFNRIENYGIIGMVKHIYKKNEFVFCDGTFSVGTMLDDGVCRENWMHDFVLLDSKYVMQFQLYCNGFMCIMYLLCVIGVIQAIKKKKIDVDEKFMIRLVFCGIWLFLMLWEASSRYVFHYLPIIVCCAEIGDADSIFQSFNYRKKKRIISNSKS